MVNYCRYNIIQQLLIKLYFSGMITYFLFQLSKAWLRGDFKESPVSLNNEV